MRKMKVLGVATLMLFLLLQVDDALSPEAVEVIDSVDWQTRSDSFIYFLGLGAPLAMDPVIKGQAELVEIRAREKRYSEPSFYDERVDDSSDPEQLELPEYDSFCSVNDHDCIPSLFFESDIDQTNRAVIELKKRYLTFMNMRGFHSMSKPHYAELYKNYLLLVRGNRIVSLSLINKARDCCPQDAVNELYNLIDLQKKYIEEVDSLIGQMISYVLLNETIDVLFLILEQYSMQGRSLSLLTQQNLSLEKVFNREFLFFYNSADDTLMFGQDIKLPKWLFRTGFKKNMSNNNYLPIIQELKSTSLMSQQGFSEYVSEGKVIKAKQSWVRNSVGTYLLRSQDQITYLPYIGRGFDLNSKITLFNNLVGKALNKEVLVGIENPYYENKFDASYDNETGRVCFSGPLESVGFARCIITTTILSN